MGYLEREEEEVEGKRWVLCAGCTGTMNVAVDSKDSRRQHQVSNQSEGTLQSHAKHEMIFTIRQSIGIHLLYAPSPTLSIDSFSSNFPTPPPNAGLRTSTLSLVNFRAETLCSNSKSSSEYVNPFGSGRRK